MALTTEELNYLRTLFEARAEVEEQSDEVNQVELDRLNAMINDNPVISSDDAEWMVEHLQDFVEDDGQVAVNLRVKMVNLIAAYAELDQFYLGLNEDNEDTPEGLAEQERLFDLIHSLNGDARR